MKTTSAAALCCFATFANSSLLPTRDLAARPVVADTTNNVTFVGNLSYGVESFLNIRYGQDTSGTKRFKAPQAFSYAAGTAVNASRPGAACPQPEVPIPGLSLVANVTDISEDCLSLRIDRPQNVSSDANLPVMVFIYGGGYAIGQVYDSVYNPTALILSSAAKDTPVIYAAMNYRVGIFGFSATPAMSPSDLNNGLLDQRLALEWIQKNIALFGGNPEDVTVFGESAGAFSIGSHLVSYGGNSSMSLPFSRAVMQSGGPTSELGVSTNATANHTAMVISSVNCTSASLNYTAELSCLQSMPLDTLLSVSVDVARTISPLGGFDVFVPVAPSPFLPAAPSELLASGSFHKNVSLISGWCEEDGSLFVPTSVDNESALEAWLAAYKLTPSAIEQVLALYPASDFPDRFPTENVSSTWFRAAQIDRDRSFSCPSLLITSAMANASSHQKTNYLYALNSTLFATFFATSNRSYLGVSHISDIPYVFNEAAAAAATFNSTQSDLQLANEMSGSWARFATTGEPQGGANTSITPWAQGATSGVGTEYSVRILGGPRDGMARIGSMQTNTSSADTLPPYSEKLTERCAFWNSADVLQMNGT